MNTSGMPCLKHVLLLFVLLLACFSCADNVSSPDKKVDEEDIPSSNWYSVYFTDPTGPAAEYYEDGPDEALVAAIDEARLSVDIAVYDMDLFTLCNALLRAHERGVVVRMVIESDNLDEDVVQEVKDANVPVLGDRRESYMHNKFVIIDRLEVWAGSMNYTSNGAYRNNNNLIRVRSTQIAENYLTEFNEMFDDDMFGSNKRANTPHPRVTIGGTPLEIYFSPDDGVLNHLLDLVDSAQERICFLAFSFTSDDLAEALLLAHKDGLLVSGVFEESQVKSNKSSGEYDNLRSAGLDVWLDANPRNMHHKVFVIDSQTVWTGSYNFSSNAEKNNDENVMVIHNPEIAALYQAECERLLAEAKR